jgi:hypothetical protein
MTDRPVEPAWSQPALGTLGLYTGWTSIAIWLNLATRMAGSGAPLTGTACTLGQLAILLGATATAAVLVCYTDGLTRSVATCGMLCRHRFRAGPDNT